MRKNLPVTQCEFDYPSDLTLMSTTDVDGNITYANEAFISISGYSRDELIGKPHNLVRHPAVPESAFADMWATLKLGKSWTALVKNRCKNGDHYWVRANVTPMVRSGILTGYVSVRTKPERIEIEQAEALYSSMREGRLRGRKLYQGLLVRTGWLSTWSWLSQTMPVSVRLFFGLFGIWLVGIISLLGIAWAVPSVFENPWLVVTLFGVSLLLFLGFSMFVLKRQISDPLQQLSRQAQDIASGNLHEVKGFDRVDEIGMIMRSINQAGLNLRALVDDVGVRVNNLSSTSGQIAHGNQELSGRTEQTAASMEQITATVKQNADTANEASALAHAASESAVRGGKVVQQVTQTMHGITESSRKISDIISVIDSIAFQTNILALNAAVEAAGAKLVERAQKSIHDIVSQVQRAAVLINEINSASVEQTEGVSQIGQAVAQLDDETQRNAALVEESSVAASNLYHQVLCLNEALSVYRYNAN